jgi:hypothetical protein
MQDTLHRATTPASQLADTAIPRFDIYNLIHKGLRLLYGDTLARIGSVDADDAGSLGSVLAQTVSLLDLLQAHYGHEDRFVHPALERVQPGSTARIEAEHVQHIEALDAMRELVDVIRASAGRTRAAALARLYQALGLHMAEDFAHMHFEDTEFNAVLWRHYGDGELLAIDRALVATIDPQTMAVALRWIVPALNAGERTAFLGGARQGMPPEVFAGVLAMARDVLPAAEWQKLARALGV